MDTFPLIGGAAGLTGALVVAFAVARFYFLYTHRVEERLKNCEERNEHCDWQLGFLSNLLRSHGIVIPTRFWSNNWRDEPRNITQDDIEGVT